MNFAEAHDILLEHELFLDAVRDGDAEQMFPYPEEYATDEDLARLEAYEARLAEAEATLDFFTSIL